MVCDSLSRIRTDRKISQNSLVDIVYKRTTQQSEKETKSLFPGTQ
jgi:hypothetical protein